jgi:hypothetical protein
VQLASVAALNSSAHLRFHSFMPLLLFHSTRLQRNLTTGKERNLRSLLALLIKDKV